MGDQIEEVGIHTKDHLRYFLKGLRMGKINKPYVNNFTDKIRVKYVTRNDRTLFLIFTVNDRNYVTL